MTKTPRLPLDPQTIDVIYGLEPVYEPAAGADRNSIEVVSVQCPYCGEAFDTTVDLSAGSFSYVEDCQVCCQPIELAGEVDDTGALVGVVAGRTG